MEVMHLNEYKDEVGITLDMLLTISRCCPKLRILGVVLDTTKPSNEDMLHIVPFNNNLELLDVGWSLLSSKDVAQVAMFLAQVLPSHCKVDWKDSKDDEDSEGDEDSEDDEYSDDDEDSEDNDENTKERWDILVSILPTLRTMKDLGRRSANK
ncbi:hypothetical protein C0992_002690 [Termitomyces sp. T32_za158]|nr:hypothetical protein C0992_002690 [Termitomyces sp. T32_za158]